MYRPRQALKSVDRVRRAMFSEFKELHQVEEDDLKEIYPPENGEKELWFWMIQELEALYSSVPQQS